MTDKITMASSSRDRSPSLPPLFIEDRSRLNDVRRASSAVPTPIVAHFDLDEGQGNEATLGISRKRKRVSDVNESVSLLGSSFHLTPRSISTRHAPIKFYPILVIPRERISLGMLNLYQAFDNITPACRFDAPDLRIVDLETRRSGVPHVLLAVNQKKHVFVIDACQEPGVFAVCQLGYWVKYLELIENASICNHKLADKLRIRQEEKAKEREQQVAAMKAKKSAFEASVRPPLSRAVGEFSRSFSVKDLIEKPPEKTENATLPTSDGVITRASISRTSFSTTTLVPVMPIVPLPTPEQTAESEALPFADAPPTSESIYDGLRTQYWEILYKSLGPLTYFAKGPLSRARAAFKVGIQDEATTGDLVTFLRSLIMTTAQLDSKYRDRIPEIIKDMKGFYHEDDDAEPTGKPKKKRNRKMKLGKDGLYPYEEIKIRDWWRNNMPDLKEDTVLSDATVKSYASLLRTRETQLQLILILEALALEPIAEAEEQSKPQNLLPGDVAVSIENNADSQKPTRRSKKQDLATLADLLADRLGIWQSTISDEVRFIESTQLSKMANDPGKPVEAPAEPLKEFCIDVIIPFFSKRLPQVCHAISKKLGGPSIIKEEKAPQQPLEPSSTIKPKQTPGAATKRTAAPRSSKSKIMSFEQRIKSQLAKGRQTARRSLSVGPSQKIQSMMAAKPREIPGLKASELKVAHLKATEGTQTSGLMKAPGLSRSQSMVDMAADPRAAKKARIDKELRDAILGIRKPNRVAAGRSIRDETEKRTGSGLSQIKRQRKPQQFVPGNSPQIIKATPMRARHQDMGMSQHSAQGQRYYSRSQYSYSQYGHSQYAHSQYASQQYSQSYHQDYSQYADDVIPPSSVTRLGAQSFSVDSYRSQHNDEVIGETPAKPRFKSFNVGPGFQSGITEEEEEEEATQPFEDDDYLGETPIKPLAIRATPARGGTRANNPMRTPSAPNPDDPFAETANMELSPLADRKSARRSGGVKGLLFPRSGGGAGKSGPMEFKSPSRTTRAGGNTRSVYNSVENSPSKRSPDVTNTLPTLPGVTPRGNNPFTVVASSSPFASATARNLAAKFRPDRDAKGAREELGRQVAMQFSPLKKSFTAVGSSGGAEEPGSPVEAKLGERTNHPAGGNAGKSLFEQMGWDNDF